MPVIANFVNTILVLIQYYTASWVGYGSGVRVKGTLRRRLTYIFSCSIKSLIYNIFTYKVWTLNFYRKGSEI